MEERVALGPQARVAGVRFDGVVQRCQGVVPEARAGVSSPVVIPRSQPFVLSDPANSAYGHGRAGPVFVLVKVVRDDELPPMPQRSMAEGWATVRQTLADED